MIAYNKITLNDKNREEDILIQLKSHYKILDKEQQLYLKMIITKLKNMYNVNSIKELSKIINISSGTLSAIQNGRKPVSTKILGLICYYAGIDFHDFTRIYTEKVLDEYQDKNGNKIIDGVKYNV